MRRKYGLDGLQRRSNWVSDRIIPDVNVNGTLLNGSGGENPRYNAVSIMLGLKVKRLALSGQGRPARHLREAGSCAKTNSRPQSR